MRSIVSRKSSNYQGTHYEQGHGLEIVVSTTQYSVDPFSLLLTIGDISKIPPRLVSASKPAGNYCFVSSEGQIVGKAACNSIALDGPFAVASRDTLTYLK